MNKAEKKEAATLFAESARLETLRRIPKVQRTEEEQKEFSRLYQKSRRRDQRGEESLYDMIETAQEFWDANTLTLTKKQLNELLEAQESVLDIERWMENGFNCEPSDPDFVSLKEGLSTITEHIVMFGSIHDHPTAYHSALLRTHAPYFATWCPKDLNDPIHGRVPAFFKQKEVFQVLCTEESKATEIYARYGIKTALSSWEVLLFQKKVANHATGADEHGLVIGANRWEVPGCWLCGLEAAEKKRNHPMPEAHQPQALVVPPTTTA